MFEDRLVGIGVCQHASQGKGAKKRKCIVAPIKIFEIAGNIAGKMSENFFEGARRLNRQIAITVDSQRVFPFDRSVRGAVFIQ
jgi:hypothetical protein